MANSAHSVVDVGSVIADTYKIEGLIGRGGMGAVFVASHNRLPGKRVAIKVLHAELHDEELLARFRREAQIASMLGHPNIVAVHDFNVTPDGMPYLVLDYLEGETLAHKLLRGPLTIEQVHSIVRQVGSALAVAHREGVVHRDLKPQNIFLVPTEVDGKLVEIAKVLDFGISKWRGSQTVKTQESALLGTPQYMAPEQATGKHDSVDARTDIFALGVIVHEMLAGQPAFSGASIPEVVFKVVYEEPAPLPSTLPAPIAAAVKQAMAKAPEARFASIGDFVEAVTGQPLTTTARGLAGTVPELGAAALAHTMDSGNHAAKLVDVSAPTIDSQRASVPATSSAPPASPAPPASTLAGVAAASSTNRPASADAPPPPATLAGTAVASTSSRPASEHPADLGSASTVAAMPSPRKRTGLIVGVVACLAAGGIVAAIAMRGNGSPAPAAKPSTDSLAANNPITDDPASGTAAANGPSGDTATSSKPAAGNPAAGNPAAGNPTTGDATTGDTTTGAATTGNATVSNATTGNGNPTTGDATAGYATNGNATNGTATTSNASTGTTTTKPTTGTATGKPAAGNATTGNATTGNATTGDATAGNATAKPTTAKPTTAKPADADDDASDADGPREVAALLDQGARAFRAGDTRQALKHASAVINQGTPLQAAKARVLRGKIYCQTGDIEGFNLELRQLAEFPRLKQRLRAACRQ